MGTMTSDPRSLPKLESRSFPAGGTQLGLSKFCDDSREGCLALTLSKRAPVPRAARASISHHSDDLRNQRDEGAERPFPKAEPEPFLRQDHSPPDVLPPSLSPCHARPISVTRRSAPAAGP